MQTSVTRRKFLKTAVAASAVVGVLGWWRLGKDCVEQAGVCCSKCGASFPAPHAFRAGTVEGLYCPNCGVNIDRLVFDLKSQGRLQAASRKAVVALKSSRPVQVPFPDSRKVTQTDKPAFVLSSLILRG